MQPSSTPGRLESHGVIPSPCCGSDLVCGFSETQKSIINMGQQASKKTEKYLQQKLQTLGECLPIKYGNRLILVPFRELTSAQVEHVTDFLAKILNIQPGLLVLLASNQIKWEKGQSTPTYSFEHPIELVVLYDPSHLPRQLEPSPLNDYYSI